MQFFKHNGVHCLVDGQYGSTGKGALSAYLAEKAIRTGAILRFHGSIYSGGPNSGHTSYFQGEKHVLKQLPTFSVYAALNGYNIPVYLSAGAIIDPKVLEAEARKYPNIPVFVHPNACIVTDADRIAESSGYIARVAGTRSGTGEALVRKIRRDPDAVADRALYAMPPNVMLKDHQFEPERYAYFMEVSQGFSLGINSWFYPKVTSRECTVMQGLADARIPPSRLTRSYMAIRTFPIRVGNVDGFDSGGWYGDQHETSWEALGVEEERTTVTNRVRRVASFSMQQFEDAVRANDPTIVFVNFMNYLNRERQINLLEDLHDAKRRLNKYFGFLVGFGPEVKDIKTEGEAYGD